MIVYMATNTINGKRYIGQTVQGLSHRAKAHKYEALNERTNMVFHKAIRKYGWDSFKWETLYEHTTDCPELLDRLERRAMSEYQPEYNMRSGGQNGYRHSEETKMKISEGNKGHNGGDRGRKVKPYMVTTPDGDVFEYNKGIESLCKQYDLNPQSMVRIVNGFADTHKGWSIEHINEEDRQRAIETRKNRSMKTGTSLRHKTIRLKSPEGYETIIENINQFCIEEGLNKGAISLVAKGKRKSHKGWTLFS